MGEPQNELRGEREERQHKHTRLCYPKKHQTHSTGTRCLRDGWMEGGKKEESQKERKKERKVKKEENVTFFKVG